MFPMGLATMGVGLHAAAFGIKVSRSPFDAVGRGNQRPPRGGDGQQRAVVDALSCRIEDVGPVVRWLTLGNEDRCGKGKG